MGAWIETDIPEISRWQHPVAPYVGAWIETVVSTSTKLPRMSHPTWVRGLKHTSTIPRKSKTMVAPYVGAWIETVLYDKEGNEKSRTLRGCVD